MTSGLGLELRSGRVRRCRGRVSVLVRWWGGGVGVAPVCLGRRRAVGGRICRAGLRAGGRPSRTSDCLRMESGTGPDAESRTECGGAPVG